MPIPAKNKYGEWPIFRSIEWEPGKICVLQVNRDGLMTPLYHPDWPTQRQFKKLTPWMKASHRSLLIEWRARTGDDKTNPDQFYQPSAA